MASFTGGFSNHLAPGLRGIIGTNLKERSAFYTQFYDMETSKRNFEDYLAATGLPVASQKPQGEAISTADPLEGPTKRINFDVWGLGFEVSEEAWDDDLYATQGSALRDAANNIADGLAERVEIEAHAPYGATGFTGTTFGVLPNNLSFFNTAHTPIAGGEASNQANRPSSPVAFSVTSFRDAEIAVMKYTNDRGLRIPGFTKLSKLIIPPDLKHIAAEVMQSGMRPDTVNPIKNVTANAVSIIVTPYITVSTHWILQAQKHFLKFFWRWRPRFDNFDDRSRRIAKFIGYERFDAVPIHWLGHFGSTGA